MNKERKLILDQILQDSGKIESIEENDDFILVGTRQLGGPEGIYLPSNEFVVSYRKQDGTGICMHKYKMLDEILAHEPNEYAPTYFADLLTGKVLHKTEPGVNSRTSFIYYSDGSKSTVILTEEGFKDLATGEVVSGGKTTDFVGHWQRLYKDNNLSKLNYLVQDCDGLYAIGERYKESERYSSPCAVCTPKPGS